jgi:hypothetical protein
MEENETGIKSRMQKTAVRWAIYAAALIVAFLIGFVPMWMKARDNAAQTAATQTQLRKAEVANLLTSAIVESRVGEYESARQKTSDFFTRLQAESDKGDEGYLTADQRTKIAPIFQSRDTLITLLAQRDQASADRLTDIYAVYQQAIGIKPVTAAPAAANTAVNANIATP